MIWRSVYEDMLADRWRARLLRFQFNCFIAQADHLELLLDVNTWLHQWRLFQDLNNWSDVEDWQPGPEQPEPLQAVERRLEARLRAVVSEVFRPLDNTEDELNLTGEAWTQIGFRIQVVLPEHVPAEGERPEQYRHAEIRATSADGLHQIRLRFLNLCIPGRVDSLAPQYGCLHPSGWVREQHITEGPIQHAVGANARSSRRVRSLAPHTLLMICSAAGELVLDPIHGYLLELLEVVLGSNKPTSQLSDVLGHFVVRVDVIRRNRTALPEGDGLELRRMLEQDGPFVGIQRVAEASRRALWIPCCCVSRPVRIRWVLATAMGKASSR
jgi:hypothetical protein